MITYATFTTAFPEFTNATVFPAATINYWIPIAYQELNAWTFGSQIDVAASLFVAHNIVLSAQAVQAAASGAIPGQATGPVTSKSVGPVSIGYDAGLTAIQGAGVWNATTYGQRLYKMMQAYGGAKYIPPLRYPGVGPWSRV